MPFKLARLKQWWANPLGLEGDEVLLAQLQLVASNQVAGAMGVFLAVCVLTWTLADQIGRVTMGLWALAMATLMWVASRHARQNHSQGILAARARAVVRRLMVGGAIHGLLWGSLGWLTLGRTSDKSSYLVLAVIAGMSGGATATLALLLPLQLAFLLPVFFMITLKVWWLGDPAYFGLGLICVGYLASLLHHGLVNARATRTTIGLRFENIALLEKLHAETQLAQDARLEAEQANAAKSKFLAAASHDLRQPIHAQGLFLEVLAHTALDAQQRELLASAGAAREASAEMLNTLLDFSRIEAGVVQPQVQAFRVQNLLNKIEREFVQQADAKGLAYRSRESALVLQSDPALVELILRNLVSNAIQYTQHGGLLVTCRRRGEQALLEVWDTGMGIAASQQAEVFREFHQLGNPERDRSKGLGLGLAIVNGLAHTLGHAVSLSSSPQRGSVFRLALPLAPGSAPAVLPAPEDNAAWQSQRRVLVIDDDAQVREGMLHLLRDWGCLCDAASTVDEALVLAQNTRPDLVISDYRLGEQRTGIEAIAALRALVGGVLPGLLITGDTAPDRLREATASGIPLLHKPVSTSQLYRALAAALPKNG
ncbi:MAG: response regulator [Burkholderiales bacterium]|nr:response regulator [Burkholderiales bacterium]